MALLMEFEGTWKEEAAHSDELSGRRVRVTVLPEPATASAGNSSHGGRELTTEEKIILHGAAFPDEEWARLPPDLSDQLDHYIYATP